MHAGISDISLFNTFRTSSSFTLISSLSFPLKKCFMPETFVREVAKKLMALLDYSWNIS